jgi:hypothetical protein
MALDQQQQFKEVIKLEYEKCAKDMVYFFKKYVYIQHPTRGRIKFNLYNFQERVLKELVLNDYNIILKSRQLGISTLAAAYALHMMLFNDDKNILAIATKQETAKNLVTKVRYMFKNLPSWMKVGVVEDNKLSLKLANGSQIKAVSSSSDSGRSEAVSMLIIDEAAHIEGVEDIWGSSQQTLATGGKAILLSTPNGVGNFFHETWEKAYSRAGETPFNPIRLHWSMHPDRNQAWRDTQEKILGPRLAAQECDADFLTSGQTVVDMADIKYYEDNHMNSPIEERNPEKNLWIWKNAQQGKLYVISADISRGDSADKSACHIFDVETSEQVAEYRGLIGTTDFGNLLVTLGTEYNDAMLIIENATMGWAVIQQVINRNYKNLYYTTEKTKIVNPNKYNNKLNRLQNKSVPGFTTDGTIRKLMVGKLEESFRNRTLVVHSKRLLSELKVFVWKNGKAEAMNAKYNDDLVLSLCFLLWVKDTSFELIKQALESQKAMLNAISVSEKVVSMTDIYGQGVVVQNPWEMDIGNGEIEKLTDWL